MQGNFTGRGFGSGSKHSPEARKKMSDARKKLYELTGKCPCGRKDWTEESLKKSNATRRKKSLGHICDKEGYVFVMTEDGQRLQHRVVMEQYLGRKLAVEENIHHIDGNRANNNISNLIIMTNSEHWTYHANLIGKHGRWSREYDCCIVCGKTDSRHQGKGICNRCTLIQFKKDHPGYMQKYWNDKEATHIKNQKQYAKRKLANESSKRESFC